VVKIVITYLVRPLQSLIPSPDFSWYDKWFRRGDISKVNIWVKGGGGTRNSQY
jgi:hypothetical protein